MLEDITWMLKYIIILINFYILYILYKKKQKGKPKRLEENKNKQILLLTAHPDDEIMFFYPLIKYLKSEGFSIHILCLTYGQLGKDKSSKIRKEEFQKVMKTLSISKFKIVNSPEILDSMQMKWDNKEISKYVDKYILDEKINCVFSFDKYGVSGHCNHSDLSLFLHTKLEEYKKKNIKIYMLETVNIVRKYFILVDIVCLILIELVNVLGIVIKGNEIFNFFMFVNFDIR